MSERITKRDVEAALERYVRALKLAELDKCADVELHWGSKTYGNSFKLWRKSGSHQYALGTCSGFIGWTMREAHATLLTIARAYEDMAFYAMEEEN